MANGDEYDHAVKRMLDIFSVVRERVLSVFSNKGKGKIRSSEARVVDVEEEDSILRATETSSLGKRKLDEHESQNPNHVSYKRRLVVTNEPVRVREPVVRKEAPGLERTAIMPEWLVNLMREENGFDAKMIFKKELTMTDLNSRQNRVLIPLSQILEKDFLNEEKQRIIMQHHRKIIDKGVDVIFVGSQGQKCELNLRRWDLKTSSNYVLVSGWFKATVNNRLRLGQTIHLWSFHSQQRLYFALVPPAPAPAMALALAPVPIRVVAPEAIDPVPVPVQALALSPVNSEELCTIEDCLEAEEGRNKIFVNFPKRKRSTLVPVAPPDTASRDSGDNGHSRREDLDPLYQLAMCCEEWLV